MSNTRQTGRLLLTPEDPLSAPATAPLLEQLERSGFTGPVLERPGERAFLVGPAFLQLVTFMGCSPHIELDPPADGGGFCHIRLFGPYPAPRLLHGRNTQPPRCHACRGRLSQWRDAIDAWAGAPEAPTIHCPRCGEVQRPLDLQWRQSAGCGRLFVAVEEIFPSEAVPVPGLLNGMKAATGVGWGYFYIQD